MAAGVDTSTIGALPPSVDEKARSYHKTGPGTVTVEGNVLRQHDQTLVDKGRIDHPLVGDEFPVDQETV